VPGACATIALAALLAGCGSSGSKTTSQPVAATTSASTPASATAAAAKPPSLRILSPAAGAHTGSTLTVRVRLAGAAPAGTGLRYVLDGHLSRHGSTRITYHELAPGRHTLVVALIGDGAVRAKRSFVVRAPTPAPEPVHTTASEPAPTPQMGAEHERAPTKTAAPEPKPSAPKPKPSAPESKPEAGGIPQGGGGDGDGDNSGGPSDGDGNV
jgi:hypothetical protein